MAIQIKNQTDYFQTDVSVEVPARIAEWDTALRAMKATAKMTVLYNQGSVQGVSIEQKSRVSASDATEIRRLLGLTDKVI